MNKQFKIIQIDSFMGICFIFFVVVSLFIGMGLFPAWIVMNLWNSFVVGFMRWPVVNWYQAGLLWVAMLLILYLLLKNNISININVKDGNSLTKEELNELFAQKLNNKDKENEEIPHDK